MEPREVALTLTLKILHPPSVCRALNTGGQRRVKNRRKVLEVGSREVRA